MVEACERGEDLVDPRKEEERHRGESSLSDPFGEERCIPCSQEEAISMRTGTTASERLFSRGEEKGDEIERSRSVEDMMNWEALLRMENDQMAGRLNEYKMAKENLERKVSEQELIIKAITASVQQLENRIGKLESDSKLLQKTNDEIMESYGKQAAVEGKVEDRLVKSVSRRFVGVAISISNVIPKWCGREVSELEQLVES